MNPFVLHLLSAVGIGFFTGLFSGLFGIGGGTVSTPLLRLFLSTDAHVAVGTTMALITPTAISGTLNYFRQEAIDKELAKVVVLPAVLGVLCGASLTKMVSEHLLMILFAVLVTIAGLDVIFSFIGKLASRAQWLRTPGHADDEQQQKTKNRRLLTSILLGLFTGFFAGFFGVGGGFILVPCFMYMFKMRIKPAIGTSLLVVAAISVPGTIMHYVLGHVDFPLMLSMMAGSIPGSLIGSALALKLDDAWLRRGFGVLMLFAAVGLAAKEL